MIIKETLTPTKKASEYFEFALPNKYKLMEASPAQTQWLDSIASTECTQLPAGKGPSADGSVYIRRKKLTRAKLQQLRVYQANHLDASKKLKMPSKPIRKLKPV